MGFLGLAVGAAACGLRPVAEIMFVEFTGVALDQVTTEAAYLHYLSNGDLTVPLVVRASVGCGLGFGLQHSRTLEQWFLGTSGLKVVAPSDAQTAYGLLRSAIHDDNPVVVLEPRALYAERFETVTGEEGVVPIGRASVVRSGSDVTMVTLGRTTSLALEAAGDAAFDAEVVDLRTLVPWDRATVIESVARTRRLVVYEESPTSGGWGSRSVPSSPPSCSVSSPPRRSVSLAPTPRCHIPLTSSALYLPQPDEVTRRIDDFLTSGRPSAPWWQRTGVP